MSDLATSRAVPSRDWSRLLRAGLLVQSAVVLVALLAQARAPYRLGALITLCYPFWLLALLIGAAGWLLARWLGARALLAVNTCVLGIVVAAGLAKFSDVQERVGWASLLGDRGFGHVGMLGTCAYSWNRPDFAVRYKYDADGARATRRPARPRGEILCLGCSFTFGVGVENDEAYPALLGQRHWPEFHVRNWGLPGLGAGDGLLLLQDWLASHDRPAGVLYGWIPNHATRNFGWPAQSHSTDDRLRWFQMENGRAVYRGQADPTEDTRPRVDDPARAQVELSVSILCQMRDCCAERDIPFAVLALAEPPNDFSPGDVMGPLSAQGVRVIDTRHIQGPFFKNDPHPTSAWHKAVAECIAKEFAPREHRK